MLDQALGLLDHHLRDLNVAGGRFVEGGRDDLALHRALHVGNFFGALIDQEHDQHDFRMVGGDGVGNILQQHGLAGARRSDDQAALTFTDRGEQVHHPSTHVLPDGLQLKAFLGIERRKVVKQNLVARLFRRLEVHRFDLDQREVLLALVGGTDLTTDSVAGLEVELADLRR